MKMVQQYYGSATVVLPPNRIEENRKEKEEKRIRIKEIYNSTCSNLSQVQKLTEKREKAIDNFLKEFTEDQFKNICKIANSTDFLIGKNDNGWKADFDFLMRIDKATNVLEGKYNDDKKSKNSKKTAYNDYSQRSYENLDSLYANT